MTDREDHWNVLNVAVEKRSAQDSVLWAIFGTFWTTSAILLVALFQSGPAPTSGMLLVIGVVGVGMSAVWAIIQPRALSYIAAYERVADQAATALGVAEQLKVPRLPGVRARDVMKVVPWASMAGWTLALLIGAWTSFRGLGP